MAEEDQQPNPSNPPPLTANEQALVNAAQVGNTARVRELLAIPGLNVNAVDNNGMNALLFAANNGNTETVRALLDARGINVNQASNMGYTALHCAALTGSTQAIQTLLAVPGININTRNRHSGETVLHVAAIFGHTETVRALLTAGADVNIADYDGRTVLHSAASWGRTEIIRVLLAAPNMDITLRTREDNKTALELARQENAPQELITLLENAERVRAQQNNPSNPNPNPNPTTPPTNHSFTSSPANFIAPVIAFVAGLFGIGSMSGGIGISSILGAIALAGGAAIASQAVTGSGMFAPRTPIGSRTALGHAMNHHPDAPAVGQAHSQNSTAIQDAVTRYQSEQAAGQSTTNASIPVRAQSSRRLV